MVESISKLVMSPIKKKKKKIDAEPMGTHPLFTRFLIDAEPMGTLFTRFLIDAGSL